MLLLKNCRMPVGDSLVECNIAADEETGKITRISRSSMAESGFDEKKDCTGLVALPGMVDCHVHFRDPGQTYKEDFQSGTAAALAGGTTTILDMPNNKPSISTIAALEDKMKIAAKKAVCDYGLHFGATPTNQQEAAKAGREFWQVKALKIYLGSSTGDLLVANATQAESHMSAFPFEKPVCVHAEDESEIREKTEKLKIQDAEGKIGYHNIIRSPKAAILAVQAACDMASKTHRKVHMCHASTKGELDIIRTYKEGGVKVTAEICTHHLFLTENDAEKLGNYGKVNPPLRSRVDVAALWDELSKPSSTVDCIATDHAPHTTEEKEKSYWDAPSGVPGVQTRLPLMLDAASKNLISMQQLVAYCSANPSRIFGLSTKGALKAGMDADITLVDLRKEKTVRAEDMLSKCKHTPYEGRRLCGTVEATVLRGKLAFDGENVCIRPGEGAAAK